MLRAERLLPLPPGNREEVVPMLESYFVKPQTRIRE